MTPFGRTLVHGTLPPAGGPVRRRLAVRAVIEAGGLFLLVRSGTIGDWKFPGGGVEASEDPFDALDREVAEETGHRLDCEAPVLVGRVWELSPGRDGPAWRFEMESRYYRCGVEAAPPQALRLDPYEQQLGFCPAWVTLDRALADNRALAEAGGPDLPSWLERETLVLGLLADLTSAL